MQASAKRQRAKEEEEDAEMEGGSDSESSEEGAEMPAEAMGGAGDVSSDEEESDSEEEEPLQLTDEQLYQLQKQVRRLLFRSFKLLLIKLLHCFSFCDPSAVVFASLFAQLVVRFVPFSVYTLSRAP